MLDNAVARRIEQALQGLEHGSVQLVIHDAHVVRIERIEKVRLTVSTEAWKTPLRQPTDSPEAAHEKSGE